jgi:type IV pilus assembly protein PilA
VLRARINYYTPAYRLTLHQFAACKKRSFKDSGFSLVEILVVIAVIGLLAAIAIPQFMTYRSEAIDAEMKSDLRNASVAIEAYYAKQSVLPASIAEIAGYGFQSTTGVTLSLVILSPTSYRVTAAKTGGTQPNFTFDSATGSIH